jgi:hypothetical protein
LKPKDHSKDISEFTEAEITLVQYILFALEENAIHQRSKPEAVRCPTLISLDLPLATFIGITGKKNKLLACTQETTRAKLERLRSARFIRSDQKTTTRHPMALNKPTSTY